MDLLSPASLTLTDDDQPPAIRRRRPGRPSQRPGSPSSLDGRKALRNLLFLVLSGEAPPARPFTDEELAELSGLSPRSVRVAKDAGRSYLRSRDGAA